jgi:hypothetical protein
MKAIMGTFDARQQIEETLDALKEAGFEPRDIALLTTYEAEEVRDMLGEEPEKTAVEGAVVGSGIGSVLGLLGSAIVLPIPGAGPLLAAGIMATASGGVLGGYLGAIYASRAESEPEYRLKELLSEDKVLLIVRVNESNETMAHQIMEEAGGKYLKVHEVDPAVLAHLEDDKH